MSFISTVEHALAAAAHQAVNVKHFVEKSVLPALKTAQGTEATVEAITSLVDPAAVNFERAAYALLGVAVKALDCVDAAVNAGGVNISLDAALVADLRAIAPALKKAAATIPVGK